MLRHPMLALLLTLTAALPAWAATPQTMNYQGLLTTAGAPVADGNYSVVFTIYDAGVAGNTKWTETRNVATFAGLFNVVLGTVTPIKDTVFNGTARWMGIKVGADPEMTPRTELSTVPYSARIATVDGASGGTITGATQVQGDVLVDGDIKAKNGVDSVVDIDATTNIMRNWGLDGNGENWRLWGAGFGQLYLNTSDAGNSRLVEVSAPSTGGEIELHSSGGADYIKLDGGETGDLTAQLPVDAVNSLEMQNEPGVASNKDATFLLSGVFQTCVLRSIICPAAGYVLVLASGTVESFHNNGALSQTTLFVSDTAGGALNQPQVVNYISSSAPSGTYESPFCVQGIFTVGAGVTTFYLRASSSVTAQANETRLSLVYFPTAYGTIASNVLPTSGDQPAQVSMAADEERAATETLSLERLKQELALQQAKLDALADRVEELQNTTASDTDD